MSQFSRTTPKRYKIICKMSSMKKKLAAVSEKTIFFRKQLIEAMHLIASYNCIDSRENQHMRCHRASHVIEMLLT